MPLVNVKRNYQVTIPAAVRDQLKIKEGDLLEATVQDDTVVLKPKVVFDRKFDSMEKPDKHGKTRHTK